MAYDTPMTNCTHDSGTHFIRYNSPNGPDIEVCDDCRMTLPLIIDGDPNDEVYACDACSHTYQDDYTLRPAGALCPRCSVDSTNHPAGEWYGVYEAALIAEADL